MKKSDVFFTNNRHECSLKNFRKVNQQFVMLSLGDYVNFAWTKEWSGCEHECCHDNGCCKINPLERAYQDYLRKTGSRITRGNFLNRLIHETIDIDTNAYYFQADCNPPIDGFGTYNSDISSETTDNS